MLQNAKQFVYRSRIFDSLLVGVGVGGEVTIGVCEKEIQGFFSGAILLYKLQCLSVILFVCPSVIQSVLLGGIQLYLLVFTPQFSSSFKGLQPLTSSFYPPPPV